MITREKIKKEFKAWRANKKFSSEAVPMTLITMVFHYQRQGHDLKELAKELKLSALTVRRIEKHFKNVEVPSSNFKEQSCVNSSEPVHEKTDPSCLEEPESYEKEMEVAAPMEFVKIHSVDDYLGSMAGYEEQDIAPQKEKGADNFSWKIKIFRGDEVESDGYSFEGQGGEIPRDLILETLRMWMNPCEIFSSSSEVKEITRCKS